MNIYVESHNCNVNLLSEGLLKANLTAYSAHNRDQDFICVLAILSKLKALSEQSKSAGPGTNIFVQHMTLFQEDDSPLQCHSRIVLLLSYNKCMFILENLHGPINGDF